MYIVPQKFGAVAVFCTIEVVIEIRKYHDYRLCIRMCFDPRAVRSSLREVKVCEKFSEIVTILSLSSF